MSFRLLFTVEAEQNLITLEKDSSTRKRLKAVRKSLGWVKRCKGTKDAIRT
jgi:hypothetical protein